MEVERGFADSTVLEQSLKLGEEVGELFKAVRKYAKMPIGSNSVVGTIDDEFADVLISYVLSPIGWVSALMMHCGERKQ
jgi:hypothetical protein